LLFFLTGILTAPFAVAAPEAVVAPCPFTATSTVWQTREANTTLTLKDGGSVSVYASHLWQVSSGAPVDESRRLTIHYEDGFGGIGDATVDISPKEFVDGDTARTIKTMVTLGVSDTSGVTTPTPITLSLRWVLGENTPNSADGSTVSSKNAWGEWRYQGIQYASTVTGTVTIDKKTRKFQADWANGLDTKYQVTQFTCTWGEKG
jgi:hypothetical protein